MNKLFLIFLSIWAIQVTYAQNVPTKISYQGILYENTEPVNGTRSISFQIENWTETHEAVQIVNGRYFLQLGKHNPLDVAVFEGAASVFLKICVDGSELEPWVELLTVPYAFFAQKAEDANKLNGLSGAHYGVPAGTIVSYGGANIPEGWLLCDGSEISRETYSRLYAALGIGWGAGDLTTTFHLPDLRGRFLRGVDMGTGRDPDAADRTSDFQGGNTGDTVGTYQPDQFMEHIHEVQDFIRTGRDHTIVGGGGVSQLFSDNGGDPGPINPYDMFVPRGGKETRPKSANVYFIIKY